MVVAILDLYVAAQFLIGIFINLDAETHQNQSQLVVYFSSYPTHKFYLYTYTVAAILDFDLSTQFSK